MGSFPNWRNEPGIVSTSKYKRSFAILPVVCSDGKKIWFKSYYKKYIIYITKYSTEGDNAHIDFCENVSEADYIVRKLSENL